ncbi:MAG: Polyprenyl synthetase superfamily [Candidatus Curtissbacteria bacterium GW2011_GWA1_40_16]|uniref:Polyprenyl synthetase superfamily n=1 Tax=Candidatus Curtissbacteria bacterium GW2011_GWA1_40_16 TaxID=1618405 RepID=A0A0G0TSZ8_9BACT|nr:MAG: Polyprenyl synthetase superfamily [Candidatus Curtissbacteria bacterium GW2011_GWA1_40_16]
MSLTPQRNKSFLDILSNFLKVFEPYADSYYKKRKTTLNKYPRLIGRFYDDLQDISKGGKRLRGFLVYLGYLIGGGSDLKKILPISLAVETIHTFLLIHDDVIDKSDMRHGKLAIHRRLEKLFGAHYGISQAIIIGDIACFEAFALVNSSRFGERAKVECQKKIYEVLLETAYGEALDIEYSYKEAKVADIMQVADLKTARYSFVGPLSVGAILSKCSGKQMKAISEFGLFVGIAFQLRDDYLGIFGDEKVLGKSILSDMREGKNTLIIHKAKQLATPKDLVELNKIWGNPKSGSRELERIRDIVRKCGALMWCEGENKGLIRAAKQEIGKLTRDRKLQQILSQVADYVVSREK